jgi:hypothetical protein
MEVTIHSRPVLFIGVAVHPNRRWSKLPSVAIPQGLYMCERHLVKVHGGSPTQKKMKEA